LKSILITGGARSGKSTYAQQLARRDGGLVLFVATAEAGDEDMTQRIKAHRKSRPATWATLEAQHGLGRKITENLGQARIVIIDCITMLVSNILQRYDETSDAGQIEKEVLREIDELIKCMERSEARFIIVTNEVGLGIVPADRLSRIYRDTLGKANQALARHADEVYLLVDGLPLAVKSPPRRKNR
jgi:adenosylcobinamide kinase/adenosylcobinamide-phosphate guanylyltransferase